MTDPVSILLIIGAAVIGPIEARQVWTHGQVAESARLFNEYIMKNPGPHSDGGDVFRRNFDAQVGIRRETLPELCERAMKDIEAEFVSIKKYSMRADDTVPGWYLKEVNPEIELKDRTPVRCIPTPSGYRK